MVEEVINEGSGFELRRRSSTQGIITRALIKNHPEKSSEEIDDLARMVILQPTMAGSEIVAIVERIEGERNIEAKDKVERRESRGDAAQIGRAELIEAINSGTNTQEEYFSWIEHGAKVIKEMNDGRVTSDDLKDKVVLVGMLDQREVELMVCLSLYRSSGLLDGNSSESEQVRARYKELEQKLLKLREVRSAVNSTTKDEVDREVTREEYETNMPYVFIMTDIAMHLKKGELKEADDARGKFRHMLGNGNRLSEEEKMKLGLLPYELDKTNQLEKELEVFSLKMQNDRLRGRREFLAEYFKEKGGDEKAMDVRKRILQLQGVEKPDTLLDKGYVEQVRKRQFDVEKFKLLEKDLAYINER